MTVDQKRGGVAVAAGVYDHAGWAVVVCVDGTEVIDRRRIELVEPGVPSLPYHHPAQKLPLEKAIALVERVQASAERCVKAALDGFPQGVSAIALRKRPKLPPTIAERIQSYYAQTRADTVMFREVIIESAEARGWTVTDYEAKSVIDLAASIPGLEDIEERLKAVGKTLGPPWTKDHRVAAAAAFLAASAMRD